MISKMRIVYTLVVSLIGVICVTSGCRGYMSAHNESIYAGRSSTLRGNITPERWFEETQRSFPANKDEVQYCMFGTNGWMRVELYPDGMPCRITRGKTTEDGERGNLSTEMEFDFDGNVISKFSVWKERIPGYSLPAPIKPSIYWQDGLRVKKIISELTAAYYIGVSYFQASNTNLEFCAWTIDRKNRQMDKLVFTLELENGQPVLSPNIKSHEGCLAELVDVVDLGGDCIGLKFKLHIDGRSIPINGRIVPGGSTFAF